MVQKATSNQDSEEFARELFRALTGFLDSANAEALESCREMMEQSVQGRDIGELSPDEAWRRIRKHETWQSEAEYLLLRQGLGRRGAATLEVRFDSEDGVWSVIGSKVPDAIGLAIGLPDESGEIHYVVYSLEKVQVPRYVLMDIASEVPVTLMTFDQHRITSAWQGYLAAYSYNLNSVSAF